MKKGLGFMMDYDHVLCFFRNDSNASYHEFSYIRIPKRDEHDYRKSKLDFKFPLSHSRSPGLT